MRERWRDEYNEYQRRMQHERAVTVAVSCIICNTIVPTGTIHRRYCKECSSKVEHKISRRTLHRINTHPSFKEMPDDLKIWKTIKEIKEMR